MKRRYKSNIFRDIYDQPYLDVGLSRMKLYKSSKNSLGMVQRLNLLKRLPVHNGCVNSISWNERGEYILSGSDDQHIIITNGFNYKVMAKFKTSHRANIFSAKFLPGRGDCHIVSCSGDGIILYTDLNRPESTSMNQFSCHSGTTYDVVTVPNDPHSFLSCGEDGTVRWFDLRMKEKCRKTSCKEDILILCERAVTSLSVNPTAPYQLAVGCSDSRVRLFDRRMLGTVAAGYSEAARTSRPLSTFTVPTLKERSCRITSLNYSPDGEEVLVSFSSDLLYLFAMNDRTNANNATVEDCNVDGPSAERSLAPVRRLRLRGDWSDTGPHARPERDGGSREPGEVAQTRRMLHSSLMQRMTDVLSRMLNDPATRANLNGGRQPQQSQDAPDEASDEAAAGSSGSQESPAATGESSQAASEPPEESPRSPVFPFEHPLNESFSINPFLPLTSPLSPEPEESMSGVVYVTRSVPGDDVLDSPMSPDPMPEDLTSAASQVAQPTQQRNSPMLQDPTPVDTSNTAGLTSQAAPDGGVCDVPMSPRSEDHTSTNSNVKQMESNGEIRDLPMSPDPAPVECIYSAPSVSQPAHAIDSNNLSTITMPSNTDNSLSNTQPAEILPLHDTGPTKILCVCNSVPSPHPKSHFIPISNPASAEESYSVHVSPACHGSVADSGGLQSISPTLNHSLPSSSTNQPLDNRLEKCSTALDTTAPQQSSPNNSESSSNSVTRPSYIVTPNDDTLALDDKEYNMRPSVASMTAQGNVIVELVTPSEDSNVSASTMAGRPTCMREDVVNDKPEAETGTAQAEVPTSTSNEGANVKSLTETTPSDNSQTNSDGEGKGADATQFTIGDPEAKLQLINPLLDENFRRDSPLSPPLAATENITVQVADRPEAMSEDETDGASENSGQEMEVESDSSVEADTQQFPRVMYPRPRQVMIPPGDMAQLRNNEDLIDTLHSMRHRHATEPAVLLSVSDVTETGAAFAVRLAPETNRGPPDIPFLSHNENVLQPQAQEGTASANGPSADQNETNHQVEGDATPNHRVIHPIEKEMDDAIEGARMSRVRSEEDRCSFQPSVKQVFSGHRNARTMIKEACFWGTDYVMSGSDCGHVFVWDRSTGQLVQLFEADEHVVNCLQPHPTLPILATSGIDYDVKLWAPLASDSTFDMALADMLKKRNEIMLEETKDTITVPATFMIRMLACLNQIRRGGRRPRRPDEEPNE